MFNLEITFKFKFHPGFCLTCSLPLSDIEKNKQCNSAENNSLSHFIPALGPTFQGIKRK